MQPVRRSLVAAVTAGLVGLAGAPAGATHEFSYTPKNTKFYMRNEGTACPGSPFLSLTPGTADPGCGFQGGAPIGELASNGVTVLGTGVRTYTSRDGVPVYLDPTRDLTGNVRVVATATTNRMAVGQVRVEVTVSARRQVGGEVILGTHNAEQLVNPTNSAQTDFPFTLNIDDSLDKVRLDELTVNVNIRGWHVLTGYHRLNDASWVDLGTYDRQPIIH